MNCKTKRSNNPFWRNFKLKILCFWRPKANKPVAYPIRVNSFLLHAMRAHPFLVLYHFFYFWSQTTQPNHPSILCLKGFSSFWIGEKRLPSPYLTFRQARQKTPLEEWQTEQSVFPARNHSVHFDYDITMNQWWISFESLTDAGFIHIEITTSLAIFFSTEFLLPKPTPHLFSAIIKVWI